MNDSLGRRLKDLFAAPARLMDRVGEAPRYLIPGLIVLVIMGGFSYLTMPITAPEQMELMRDSKIMRLMPEDAWQQQYEQAMNPTPLKRTLQSVGSAFSIWISMLLFGFILGFFARISGGQGSMRQALGIVSWASLIPFGVAMVIKLPLIMMTESAFRITLGLAAFAPGDNPMSPLHQFLMTYGDFFTWWGLAVLVVGFERVFKLSRGTAAVAVILPWAVASAIPLGISLIMM